MPTYHFRCEACSKTTTEKLPFGSTEIPSCATCKKPMVKVIVPPMVHFKGSGFYKTDSSAKSGKATEAPKPTPSTPKTPPPSPNTP